VASGKLFFQFAPTQTNRGDLSYTTLVTFDGLNASVGIGTTSPASKLDVNGTVRLNDNDIYLRSPLGTPADIKHGLGWYGTNKTFATVAVDGPVIYGNTAGALGIYNETLFSGTNNQGIVLYWDKNGKVGINTTTTTLSSRLQVHAASDEYAMMVESGANNDINFLVDGEGNVYARMVKVIAPANSIPDYVFEKKYKLMEIKDLEIYVNEHKHFPNIPSRDEIVNDGGVDLSDMQLKMLEKIEEMSLYIISLQKQIDELKKEQNIK
jgi:hypothetical protein